MSNWTRNEFDGRRLLKQGEKFVGQLYSFSFTCFRCGSHVENGKAAGAQFRCSCGRKVEPSYAVMEFLSRDPYRVETAIGDWLRANPPAPAISGDFRFERDLDEDSTHPEQRDVCVNRAGNYDPDPDAWAHPASGPLISASPVFGHKHKASERLRALAQAACGTGRPAISSHDMRIRVSWEQLELVATELEKMGL